MSVSSDLTFKHIFSFNRSRLDYKFYFQLSKEIQQSEILLTSEYKICHFLMNLMKYENFYKDQSHLSPGSPEPLASPSLVS